MPWEALDHTADAGVVVTAPDREALFVEAVRAMTDCITELDTVRADLRREVRICAATADLLLVDWLSEALYRFEVEGFLAADARLTIADREGRELALTGELLGELRAAERHPHKVGIKAITYHGLEVGPRGGGWVARCIFDI
jgi:SHS2 domain-containing protein